MATILVTGGAGFIGSHLVELCLQAGHRVLILDDLSSGTLRNLSPVRSDPRLEFVKGSALDRVLLAQVAEPADVIFHLAARVGVFAILDHPATATANNIGATESVLAVAMEKKRKVIIASSSEVYGKSPATPFRECADSVLGPVPIWRWSYAAAKLVDEHLALGHWREFGLPVVVVRLFNTIGPRQCGRYGMVVPRFLGDALAGRDLTIFGTGLQTRCFAYVTDIVRWMLRLAEDDRAVGQSFNLGNPAEEVTIVELARRVITVAAAGVGIRFAPYQACGEGFEEVGRRVPDIGKVQSLTGYSPRTDLDTALRLTRDWIVTQNHEALAARV